MDDEMIQKYLNAAHMTIINIFHFYTYISKFKRQLQSDVCCQ